MQGFMKVLYKDTVVRGSSTGLANSTLFLHMLKFLNEWESTNFSLQMELLFEFILFSADFPLKSITIYGSRSSALKLKPTPLSSIFVCFGNGNNLGFEMLLCTD